MDKKYHNSIERYTTENIVNTYGSPIVKKMYNRTHSKQVQTLEEEKLQHKIERNQKIKYRISSYASNLSGLLGSIILILVGIAMIRLLYYGSADSVSFRSLLDLLSNAPQVSTSVKNFYQSLQFTEPWAILDGIRIFLNNISQIVGIGVWIASSLIDVIIFITYFLIWIFI